MITWLSGKKTYLLSVALFAYVVGGYFTGHIGLQEALGLLFSSATIASIRAAIEKNAPHQ